jgi:D-alanyl-D-alanine carboxypeptidase/D-alanyl-D-alanine-endopeptidase (penicillin-binding protein 4)
MKKISSYKDFVFILFVLITAQNGVSQQVTAPAEKKTPKESAAIEQLQQSIINSLADKCIEHSFAGILIQSAKTGEILFKQNERRSFLPASNMKLFTTAAALGLLGADFQYSTEVYLDGEIRGKTLFGNLIVRGSGDPTLGSQVYAEQREPTYIFEYWADSLRRRGIERIEGNIIIEDRYFNSIGYPNGWSVEDIPYGYAPQVSAFCFADNTVSVSVTPNQQIGSKPFVTIVPETEYFSRTNRAVTVAESKGGASRNSVKVSRELGSTEITVSGDISKGSSPIFEQISAESPALYGGTVLRETLEFSGIPVRGGVLLQSQIYQPIAYHTMTPVIVHRSPKLSEIVKQINKRSNNFYAEQVFLTLGKEVAGRSGWFESSLTVTDFLKAKGIDTERISISDGSGLSRMNLLTPESIVSLLRTMTHTDKGFKAFYESLPILGEDGTLESRLKGTPAAGRIAAKTGLLTGVRSISGYARSKEDEMLCFSIIFNNFTCPVQSVNRVQDSILTALANFSRR